MNDQNTLRGIRDKIVSLKSKGISLLEVKNYIGTFHQENGCPCLKPSDLKPEDYLDVYVGLSNLTPKK